MKQKRYTKNKALVEYPLVVKLDKSEFVVWTELTKCYRVKQLEILF